MTDATAGAAPAAPAMPVKSGLALWLGFGAMIIGQFMAFLDLQIVASSLQQIQSGIGASADELADFGTVQASLDIAVAQVSATVGAGQARRRQVMVN